MDLFICLAGLVGEQQPWGTLESIGDAVSQAKNYDMLSRREKGYSLVCLSVWECIPLFHRRISDSLQSAQQDDIN